MARPTVLVVDRDDARRKDVVRRLTSLGYDVVAAADAAEGRRFAAGLEPGVVAAEAGLGLYDDALMDAERGEGPLRIVLSGSGAPEELGTTAVGTAGLSKEALVGKVRTALLSRELGIAADRGLEALEGDLQTLPVLELVPRLQRAVVTGRVLLGDGEVTFEDGEVVASKAESARGIKAFARLARTAAGGFRILLGPVGTQREIQKDVLSLMALAMEDGPRFDEAAGRLPDLASRLRPVLGPVFFATQFSPTQQQLLAATHEGDTVWDVVDRVDEPDGSVLEAIAHLNEMGVVAFDAPEVKVRIVTDSTADLPPALAERHDVLVVPLSVIVGGEIFKDGVDLKPAQLFKLLEERGGRGAEAKPPTRGEFLAAYRAIVGRKDVVSLHVSSRLSSTFEHACQAVAEGGEDFRRVRGEGVPALEVVDSMLASTPLALLVVLAARMAARRLEAREIRARLEAMCPRVHVVFAVSNAGYISRSGRVKGAQGFLGGILGIKPILGIHDGEVVPVEKVRGETNVSPRLVELLKARVDVQRPVLVGIGHAAAQQAAVRLRSLLQEQLRIAELLENEIGPAVGLHVGPGCVGAAILQPSEEELTLVTAP